MVEAGLSGVLGDAGTSRTSGASEVLAHLVKRRRDFTVDVRLRVEAGGALALFGSSGAGKSTVLGCLAGFERLDTGFVQVGGAVWFRSASEDGDAVSVPLHLRDVGLLTQQPGLFPHLSVGENVLFGLDGTSRRDAGTRRWVETLRERLGLGPLWEARPRAISGGQARQGGAGADPGAAAAVAAAGRAVCGTGPAAGAGVDRGPGGVATGAGFQPDCGGSSAGGVAGALPGARDGGGGGPGGAGRRVGDDVPGAGDGAVAGSTRPALRFVGDRGSGEGGGGAFERWGGGVLRREPTQPLLPPRVPTVCRAAAGQQRRTPLF